jgi:predicted ferric reductase
VIHQAGSLLTSYPDVLMATAAFGLFLLVAVLSARAARRRLRYETWYYIHLYAYLALALSFAHVFADGNDFRADPASRIAWAALYAGTGVILFAFRVAVPAWGAFRYRLRVVAVRREASGATSLHIAGRNLQALHPQPGQFFRWRFLTRDGWWQSHPFSVSALPHSNSGRLRITVKALGDYTASLQHTRPGTRVIAEGPYWAVTPAARRSGKVALLAGGVGITAIRTLAEAFAGGRPHQAVLLYRVNTEREVVFRAELDALARRGGLDVHYLVGPPGSAADVLAEDRLTVAVPDIAGRDVFVCGPAGFTEAALQALRRCRVPAAQVHTERYEF